MTNMIRLFKSEEGATAIEYGLIAALIAIACVIVLGQVGTSISTTFSKVNTELTTANR